MLSENQAAAAWPRLPLSRTSWPSEGPPEPSWQEVPGVLGHTVWGCSKSRGRVRAEESPGLESWLGLGLDIDGRPGSLG